METKEYRTIDKSIYPKGPWTDEPDKVQWPDPATGLPCLAVRQPRYGNWCGYVGVAPGHPLHGVPAYADAENGIERGANDVVSAHGGITFTDVCMAEGDEAQRVCHVPGPGEPEHVWWIGFDCAHCYDFSPFRATIMAEVSEDKEKMHRLFGPNPHEIYRDLDYVKRECAELAAQLRAAA